VASSQTLHRLKRNFFYRQRCKELFPLTPAFALFDLKTLIIFSFGMNILIYLQVFMKDVFLFEILFCLGFNYLITGLGMKLIMHASI